MIKFDAVDKTNGVTKGNKFSIQLANDKIYVGVSINNGGMLVATLDKQQLVELTDFLNKIIVGTKENE